MEDHKESWKVKIRFYFSTFGLGSDNLFKQLRIEPETKGIINKQVIGVKFRFDSPVGLFIELVRRVALLMKGFI